jgi:hypothetical protein
MPITPKTGSLFHAETQFIADHSHFARIDPTLTPPHINRALGIDLVNQPVELIQEPAALLNSIYGLAGALYTKSAADVRKTVQAINFSIILNELPARAPNFEPLKVALLHFFSPPWRRMARQLAALIASRTP